MSRGIGSFQQRILKRIETVGTVSLNKLCWDMATERGSAAPSITASFNSGFRRSVSRLAEQGYIQTAKRRLTDFDGLTALYPYKSRDAVVKSMRLQLLPLVKAYCVGRPGKFSRAQNEAHIYEALSDETRAAAARSWQGLEADLFAAMSGALDRQMRDAIFDLLVRGRELFMNQPVRHRTSLTRLLDRALVAADGAPVPALRDLGSLAASLFPAPDLARLRFKSGVYSVAHLGRDHHPTIKEEFIKYLMQEAPAVMRSLPGFKAARSERVGKLKLPIREVTSPLVHKLVRRDALAPFEFLSVRQNNDQPAAEENQPATRRELQPA